MTDKLINGIWHIKTDPHGKFIRMSYEQLNQKIEAMYKEIKADKLLIKAQAQQLNK